MRGAEPSGTRSESVPSEPAAVVGAVPVVAVVGEGGIEVGAVLDGPAVLGVVVEETPGSVGAHAGATAARVTMSNAWRSLEEYGIASRV